jgi:hypothetical protein
VPTYIGRLCGSECHVAPGKPGINRRVTINFNQPFSGIAEDPAMDWAAIATLALIGFVILLVILISINLRR